MQNDFDLIKVRYKKARAKADLWISLLEACYHYTVPFRNLFYWTSQYQGAMKNARVYDTTPVYFTQQFVSKIQNGLCPPQKQWYLLEAGPDIPEDQKERVNIKLKEQTDILFFYIRNSNFDLAASESLYDLAIGTLAIIANPGPSIKEPLQYYSVPLARIAIEETASNRIETVFRWWDEIRIADIELMWPEAVLSQEVMALFAEDENATLKDLVEGTIYYPKNKPSNRYRYVVYYENHMFVDSSSDETAWTISRWTKVNNEAYGRGPVINALPSILTLQEAARIEYTSANFNMSKPYMAYADGIFNPYTFRLEPNTVIPVAPNPNGQWPIQSFPDTANPQFQQLTTTELRQQIGKLLYADPFMPAGGPSKTATETAIKQRNLVEEIGPAFTRMQQEFSPKILQRTINILQSWGLMDKIVIDNRNIQLTYKSPLVIEQGLENVKKSLELHGILAQIYGPETAAINYDPVKYVAWARDQMGVDPRIMISEEKMESFLASKSEQLQEAQMAGAENNGPQEQPLPNAGGPA